MEKTLFEKIALGEIPSYKIWEDDQYLAFLDINPITPGHTLVIPKVFVGDHLFDLSDSDFNYLLEASHKVGKILKEKLKLPRIFMLVEGLEVAHVHIHLIPSDGVTALSQMVKKKVSPDELQQMLEILKS